YERLSPRDDFANHGGLFDKSANFFQPARFHTKQQATAGLCVCENDSARRRCFFPIGEFVCSLEVVAAAAGHAIACDQIENFLVDYWNFISADFRACSAGATHGREMTKQAKASDVYGGAH